MATFTYEGVSFNVAHNTNLSLEEFIKHESHHGLKKEQLTEAHKLMKRHVNAAKKAEVQPEKLQSVIVDEDGKTSQLAVDESEFQAETVAPAVVAAETGSKPNKK
jgi:hypothetical protein